MDISGIISISGKSGLSKIVSQSRNGIIVESLVDGKKFPVMGTERVSSLEDISIYTYESDVLLLEVFKKMFKTFEGKKAISHKSSAKELSKAFKEVLPNYDEDRVYNSDIKKVFQWYNLLLEQGYLKAEEKEATKSDKEESTTKQKKAKAPKKKAKAKKEEPKDEEE
ncbi:MAG: DUF5606 domain-containing protein [Vicingaceae bacterium]